jgi:hypothetical protein
MRCAEDRSNVVDIFDASSGRWSTAALSVARNSLAATSLPNQGLAIFAGGATGLVVHDFFAMDVAKCCVMRGMKGGGGICT